MRRTPWPETTFADRWGEKKIAILHDNTTYGKGLAEEAKKQLNKRAVTEAIYKAYDPGKTDYSAEIAALQAGDIAVVHIGDYFTKTALMARAVRDHNYSLQLVPGDDMTTEAFCLVAGAAVEGTVFTFTQTRVETLKPRQASKGSESRTSSPIPGCCTATPPFRPGCRRLRRPARSICRRRSHHCAVANLTPYWAGSSSTKRMISLFRIKSCMCGKAASTCRWSNKQPVLMDRV